MKPLLPLLCGLLLAACVAPGASVQTVGDTRLQVREDDNYYWPATASGGISVFPIVDALVVSRADGAALAETDEIMARAAVEAHCRSQSMGVPSKSSRFADGAWAYFPCGES